MKSKAFTLIELLVVIAIIAILAAILFPVFAQAKLAAKKTVALSNMKNLSLAMQIYQGDYDDSLIKSFFGAPNACSGGSSGWGNATAPVVLYSWRHALYPYSKSEDILRDSTNQFAAKSFDFDTSNVIFSPGTPVDNMKLSTNYAANDAIIGFANPGCWDFNPNEPAGLDNATSLQNPASTIELFPNRTQYQDGHWYWGSNDNDGGLYSATTIAQSNGSQLVASYNCLPGGCPGAGFGPFNAVGKNINFAFADGHAKAESFSASVKANNPNDDDWGASLYTKDTAGNAISQAERQYATSHTFTEYQ